MLLNAHIWSTGAALMRAVAGTMPSSVANMSGLRLGRDAEPSKEGQIHGSPHTNFAGGAVRGSRYLQAGLDRSLEGNWR